LDLVYMLGLTLSTVLPNEVIIGQMPSIVKCFF